MNSVTHIMYKIARRTPNTPMFGVLYCHKCNWAGVDVDISHSQSTCQEEIEDIGWIYLAFKED